MKCKSGKFFVQEDMMKMFSRLLVAVVTVMFVAGLLITPVNADTQVLVLTPTEEYVKGELLADGDVDLTGQDDPAIRGEVIVTWWKDPAFQNIPFFKIRHATIKGNIEAEGLTIPFNVEFHFCTFDGRINLESADTKTFRIDDDSTVKGSVRMGRMVVDGDLALYNSTFEGIVTLFDANISNNLFAKGSKFLALAGDQNSTYPFELWTIEVGKTAEFENATFKGFVMAKNAEFVQEVNFKNATFEKNANFEGFTVGDLAEFQEADFYGEVSFESGIVERDIKFSNAVFNGNANFKDFKAVNLAEFDGATFNADATFESGIVERDTYFTNATFNGNANFDYFSSSRFMDFVGTTFNKKFSFTYTLIGWPYFANAAFNGPVDFEGMQATNDFELTDATYSFPDKPFTVYLARVEGRTLFTGFTSQAGLVLTHNHFTDLEITSRENQIYTIIDLSSTLVDGNLRMEDLVTSELNATGTSVSDSTLIQNVSVTNELDMSNASVGIFNINNFSWPTDPASFNLRGMTYTDIGLVDRELNDETWTVFKDMVGQSAYSPQAYRTLAQSLIEKGHPEWAADLELSGKRREKNQILKPSPWEHLLKPPSYGPWLWSWFLDIFSGYGQRPQFAFGWSLLVVVIGSFVFRKEKDMVVLVESKAIPPYNPLLYSFALFLPYIDLEIASKWDPKPERKYAGIYKHIHRLLGWILMPIALLTFGGIIG